MRSNDLYREIEKRILLLDYEPGTPLSEKQLAGEFSVSRTPIREALIRLEAEGLVRIVPNRGVYVEEVSFTGLRNAIEVRLFLLDLVGKLAPKRVTDRDLDQLRQVAKRMEEESDPRILRELDLCFHDLLNASTRNATLATMLARLRNQVTRAWNTSHEDDEAYFPQIREECATIIKALEERDGVLFLETLREHVHRFISHLSLLSDSSGHRQTSRKE